MKNEKITLWLDEGIPVVRGGIDGRGEILARGSSLTEGKSDAENDQYIRSVVGVSEAVTIYRG